MNKHENALKEGTRRDKGRRTKRAERLVLQITALPAQNDRQTAVMVSLSRRRPRIVSSRRAQRLKGNKGRGTFCTPAIGADAQEPCWVLNGLNVEQRRRAQARATSSERRNRRYEYISLKHSVGICECEIPAFIRASFSISEAARDLGACRACEGAFASCALPSAPSPKVRRRRARHPQDMVSVRAHYDPRRNAV